MTPLLVTAASMCCAVGHSVDTAVPAIEAGFDLFRNTDFYDFRGKPIKGAPIIACTGEHMERLADFFTSVFEDCRAQVADLHTDKTCLVLIVAEQTRAGVTEAWAQALFDRCRGNTVFHATSRICPWGKAGLAPALLYAREMLQRGGVRHVLLTGVDSLLDYAAIEAFKHQYRLAVTDNSNGFIPGEGAGAVLLSLAEDGQQGLLITGIGHAQEEGHRLQSEKANLGRGLTVAIRQAVQESGNPLTETALHMSGCAGDAADAREAVMATVRCLESHVPQYPHFMLSNHLGETGAAVGPLLLAYASRVLQKEMQPNQSALIHCASDNGHRAACIVRYE